MKVAAITACLIASVVLKNVFCKPPEDPRFHVDTEVLSKPDDCAKTAAIGDQLTVHYKGSFKSSGEEFDSSYEKGQPFTFGLGRQNVFDGWEEGIVGMCVGEKRQLTVTPTVSEDRMKTLSEEGLAGITFVYVVELIKINEEDTGTFNLIDQDRDKKLSLDEVTEYILDLMAKGSPEMLEDSVKEEQLEQVQKMFHDADKDMDGFISYEEFPGPKHDEL